MTPRKHSTSRTMLHRSLSLAVAAAIAATPVAASAAAVTPAAKQAITKTAAPAKPIEGASTSSVQAPVRYAGSSLEVGDNRPLTRTEIRNEWDDLDPDFSTEKAVEAVKSALPQKEFEELYPYRLGSAEWFKAAAGKEYYKADQTDYFSYDNLIAAVTEVANIKYKVSTRVGDPKAQEVSRLDKELKVETLVARSAEFNSADNVSKPIHTVIVDYGSFLKEGTKKDRKRELAALLAHLSHETGGGWDTAPGGPLRWGLFWNENIAGRTGQNKSNFVDPASIELFPGYPDKRYYGRGPIMMSLNFNYGLFSAIIYGDKTVLLKNPEIVAQDGKVGYMTAILFWMTPQAPKPSAHDVMVGRWKPNAEEIAKGLKPAGFGVTTMVINGLEANQGETRRAAHYKEITKSMGIDITGEKLDTLGMQTF